MPTARCPNGHEVLDDKPYCGRCGAAVSWTCPNGHGVAVGVRYCSTCGAEREAANRGRRNRGLLAGAAVLITVGVGAWAFGRGADDDDASPIPDGDTVAVTEAPVTTTPVISTTTRSTPLANESIVLSSTGIGVAELGDDADEAIATLTEILGPPDVDEPGTFQACAGGTLAYPAWGDLSIETVATDRNRFVGYYYGSFDELPGDAETNRFLTDRGITLGSSLADLSAAYDGRVEVVDGDEFGGPYFSVAGQDLRGVLSGTRDDAVVQQISAGGAGCD